MNWDVFTPFISFGKHSNQNLKTQWMGSVAKKEESEKRISEMEDRILKITSVLVSKFLSLKGKS